MCHFEVHNNEQSHGINVLDVRLCLLNLLAVVCFVTLSASERASCVCAPVCLCDGAEVSPENFFFFCRAALLFCLLWWIWSLMKGNNVPYEGEMCSLIQQIPLADLKGGNLSWRGGEGGFLRWCHWQLSKLCNSSGVVWWPNGLLLLVFLLFYYDYWRCYCWTHTMRKKPLTGLFFMHLCTKLFLLWSHKYKNVMW